MQQKINNNVTFLFEKQVDPKENPNITTLLWGFGRVVDREMSDTDGVIYTIYTKDSLWYKFSVNNYTMRVDVTCVNPLVAGELVKVKEEDVLRDVVDVKYYIDYYLFGFGEVFMEGKGLTLEQWILNTRAIAVVR